MVFCVSLCSGPPLLGALGHLYFPFSKLKITMVNTSSIQNLTSRGCNSKKKKCFNLFTKFVSKNVGPSRSLLGGWFELLVQMCPFRPKEKISPLKERSPFGQNCVLFIPPLLPCCGHESILLDQPWLLSPVCVCVYFCVCPFV